MLFLARISMSSARGCSVDLIMKYTHDLFKDAKNSVAPLQQTSKRCITMNFEFAFENFITL